VSRRLAAIVALVAGLTVAALALVGVVALLVTGGSLVAELLVLAGLLVTLAAARAGMATGRTGSARAADFTRIG
jgi:hypothetical protein